MQFVTAGGAAIPALGFGTYGMARFDFELSAAEMAAIHGLAQADSRIVNPPGLAPAWDATAPSHTRPTPPSAP
jgi:hypothetical protein